MSFQRLFSVLVLAASVVAACSGDEQASVFEPDAHGQQTSAKVVVEEAQQQSPAQASTRKEKVDRAAESRAEAVGEDMPEQNAPPASSVGEEAAQGAEQAPRKASPASDQSEVENAESEPEEPPLDSTDVPATVIRDADVLIRPGLAWQAVDRLELGARVTALQRAGGWVRVRYGDGLAGWIRSTALDLGEIEESQILERAAPPLIAEWRGEQYGVMGQSADGKQVRLLQVEGETPRIIGAPINEVRLLDTSITLNDLPILLGDETVVFPGDDFRVGQGRILPRANEWMWLDDGNLLAHNDTHIWQWRPETDESEFIERPPGYAKLSPDGRYLAIANLCPSDLDCSRDNDVVLVPLYGSTRISFSEQLSSFEVAPSLGTTSNKWISNLEWSGNSKAVKLLVSLFDAGREPSFPTTLVLHVEGHVVRFEEFWEEELEGERCKAEVTVPGPSFVGGWEFHDHETIASRANCIDAEGNLEFRTTVFTLTGDFVRFEPLKVQTEGKSKEDLVRSAAAASELGYSLEVEWSPTSRHALVTSNLGRSLWLFDAMEAQLRPIDLNEEEHPTFPEGSRWNCGEADRFCWTASWYEDAKLAVMWESGGKYSPYSSGGYLIDVSSGTSVPMAFWSLGVRSWWTSHDWRPTGDLLRVRFWRPPEHSHAGPFRWDGLVAHDPDLAVVVIVRDDGTALQFLFPGWACGSECWSPGGRWFAIVRHALSRCFSGL
ncbi:MAG: hypothetical protein F4W96_09745 [Chloroflexi bacterium]|nr:hypothetical protein [Chloroflexota bacterium]